MSMNSVSPVSLEELVRRSTDLLTEMRQKQIGVVILTIPDDIYFLSGYYTRAMTSNTALIMSLSGDAVLVTRHADEGNYLRIKERSPIKEFISFTDDKMATSMEIIAAIALSKCGKDRKVGVEAEGIFTPSTQFKKLLTALGDVETVEVGDFVSRQRLIKSDWELECHRAAARMTVEAMRVGIASTKVGALDSDIAADVAAATIRAGSEWGCTWPIIVTGAETGRSHSSWRGDKVAVGQPTTLEFSAVCHRYHSPLFRTVIYSPSKEYVRLSEAVSLAHKACVDRMSPGTPAEDVFEAKRAVFDGYGVADLSKGRAGYTVGIGFPPNWVQRNAVDLMKGNKTTLQPGMVFHIVTTMGEKNVYGIAHSSTVVITSTGHEVLTPDGLDGPVLL